MRTPVANVDAAWLHMDDPTNLMVVTGLFVLEKPLSLHQTRSVLEKSLARFPRFTQRIVEPASGMGTPAWETDPYFCVDNHLFELELEDPDSEAELQSLVSRLMSQTLNMAQPLWHFYLVPHYQGGSALIGRIHHVIGDGLALIYVILSMADGGPEPPSSGPTEVASSDAGFWESIGRSIAQTANLAVSLPASVVKEAGALLAHPERLVQMTGQMQAGIGALAKLLLIPPDPATSLKGPLVAEKKVVWSPPIDVDDLKRIGRATGSTINDVLMSAVSGALRGYLAHHGAVAPDLDVRGVIPVNLRAPEEAHLLGNQFGLVFLSFPLGLEDPLDRLFEVRRRMTAIKHSPEAYVTFQILRAMGVAPRQVFDLVLSVFGAKATAVVTNVIGPREPMSFAGTRVRQVMFWVPCAGRLGLGLSVLSYAGEVWLGVQTDAGLIPDPERILDGFLAEIDALSVLEREVERL
jgi:diacylglycerol O-acyltransferase / wax synthase